MRFALALIPAALFISHAFAADPVYPPGSRVGLVPPPGILVGEKFQGFHDPARSVIALVRELSLQSYAKVEEQFSDHLVRSYGAEPMPREIIDTPGGQAVLFGMRAVEHGVPTRKWAVLMRTDDITGTVILSMPEAAFATYPEAVIRRMLASAVIRDKLSTNEMLAILPYRLEAFGGFRLMRASPDGDAVLTLGPNDTTLPIEQPYFTVVPYFSEAPPTAERESFARRMLVALMNGPVPRIVSSQSIRVGGAQVHEIIAESEDGVTKDPLMLVQWLRFGPGMLRMFGIARKDQWADALPRMRAVRDGFQTR